MNQGSYKSYSAASLSRKVVTSTELEGWFELKQTKVLPFWHHSEIWLARISDILSGLKTAEIRANVLSAEQIFSWASTYRYYLFSKTCLRFTE